MFFEIDAPLIVAFAHVAPPGGQALGLTFVGFGLRGIGMLILESLPQRFVVELAKALIGLVASLGFFVIGAPRR